MTSALVGYTGFVGSNIYASAGDEIRGLYNSKNISEAYGTKPDLLIYAGLRAEKYLANQVPSKDMELICQAQENIQKIEPEKLVLISTIDVFKTPNGVDENSQVDIDGLGAYGFDRYQLELWVREKYPDALIIRLPALFGKNLKKNFIYDYIHLIPFKLREEKYLELSSRDPALRKYYFEDGSGFYKVHIPDDERADLKERFIHLGFTALHFTDSRGKYQFYNLANLWDDMQTALQADIHLLHLATEPVSAGEIYRCLSGDDFYNVLSGAVADYDYRTIHADMFGGANGYICKKEQVLKEIRAFVETAPV